MYCLDTSILIDIFDGKEDIKAKLEDLGDKRLSITALNLCELYKGAIHSGVTKKRMEYISNLLKHVDVIELNEYSCTLFGQDYLKLKSTGKLFKDFDLMIAAICKANNRILITSDRKHFVDIPNLKVELW
jgi:tRNA(fMet)-specific endonuclease VapC